MAAEGGGKYTEQDQVPGRVEEDLCQPCLNKDIRTVADKFCTTCKEFQCAHCSNVHNTYAFMRNHELVNASDAKVKQTLFDMKGFDKCDQHHEILKFLCEDENELCCGTCAIVGHRKCHSVVEVEKIAEKLPSTGSGLQKTLQEIKENAEFVVNKIISSKEQVKDDAEEMPKIIGGKRDAVIKLFNDLEVYVMKKVESFKADSLAELDKKQSRNEGYIADATQSLETINKAYENGTPAQRFIVEKKMEKHSNALYNKVNEECQDIRTVVISFDFDETLKLPPLPISDYVPGKLTLKSHLSKTFSTTSPVKPTMKLIPIISITLTQFGDDTMGPLYSGIDFLPDGRLIAVDNSNDKFLVYNEKLEKVGSYQLSFKPFNAFVLSEENVAITSGGKYEIHFLKVSETNKITLDKSCSVKTEHGQICLEDGRQFIVATVDEPVPVRIVSSVSGDEKDFSVVFPNKAYPIGTSFCTYIKNSDKVVITDRHNHTVYIYDVKTKTRVVVKDDQIQEPCGAAVGPSDTVLICSKNTNTIIQMSQTGQILSSFEIDIHFLKQICVSKCNSFLAVTNSSIRGKKLMKLKIA